MTNEGNRDPNGDIPYLYRWCFSLKTGAVKEEKLDKVLSEFLRVNE
ncbi:MAG: hypothetical protein F6K25_05605 [Okeania sp. SIO2G4]|nr:MULTISPECIES: hypothetical protein [unclassified Okeania]NEP06754.1 hypothetical protein [Okeania sp. SIO4D6]NEP39673.1 hypothetical protein [Okeania sp. SIO2H7]NEP71280.1 hypothetical protein [Okeania sp. SIO2G5]NEP92188.1 hypothetical protein [Okeania sp. SIO2F5]NEQ90224.1 hypothetical protein [Okeania sp. SIO2G4]